MKRVVTTCLILMLLSFFGCAKPQPKPEMTVVIQPVLTAVLPPPPTMAPTATLAPTPEPTRTPAIMDDWYLKRTEQMRVWMRQFGDYGSEEAIEAQLALWDIDPDRPMIALTFDDGPSPTVTDQILDILARYNLRAMFFVKGVIVKKGEEQIKRAVAQGCEIGNHTWTHRIMNQLEGWVMREELQWTNEAVEEIIGVPPRVMRPPGGSFNQGVCDAARRCGLAVVRWSQSGNVKLTDPEMIAATVMHQEINGKDLRDGDIILLHDTHEYMVRAVELMIPMILERGYQFVTVSEILELTDEGLIPGVYYCSQYGVP